MAKKEIEHPDIQYLGNIYSYNEFYKRYESLSSDTKFAILCPKCKSAWFSISYGDYECIANCRCGNSFVICLLFVASKK